MSSDGEDDDLLLEDNDGGESDGDDLLLEDNADSGSDDELMLEGNEERDDGGESDDGLMLEENGCDDEAVDEDDDDLMLEENPSNANETGHGTNTSAEEDDDDEVIELEDNLVEEISTDYMTGKRNAPLMPAGGSLPSMFAPGKPPAPPRSLEEEFPPDRPIDSDKMRARLLQVFRPANGVQDKEQVSELVQFLHANVHRLPSDLPIQINHVYDQAPTAGPMPQQETPSPAQAEFVAHVYEQTPTPGAMPQRVPPVVLSQSQHQSQSQPQSQTQLAAVMASHISNETRLGYLRACLDSISEQTVLPRTLILGISHEAGMKAELSTMLERASNDLLERGCMMRVRMSGRPLTQFEHFQATLKYLDGLDPHETWVFFSDDDDVWHPRRTESYAAAVRGAPPTVSTMASPVHAVNIRPLAPGSHIDERALALRRHEDGDATDNYWGLITRLQLWRDYFDDTPAAELQSVFADVHFSMVTKRRSNYQSGSRLPLVHALGGEGNWMYLWRQDHQGNPQHTEQQKSRLTPIVKQGLEQYFSRPVNKRRYCADMAKTMGMPTATLDMGGSRGGRAKSTRKGGRGVSDGALSTLEQVATVDMMTHAFLDDIVKAETAVELFRINLRMGGKSADDLLAAESGLLEGRGRAGPGAESDASYRASLNPAAAKADEYAQRIREQPGVFGTLGAQLMDHTDTTMSAYKRTRLGLMEAKGYGYEPLTPKAVHEAFMRTMMDRAFM